MTTLVTNLINAEHKFSTVIDLLQYRADQSFIQPAYTFLQNGETEQDALTYQTLHLRAKAIAAHLQTVVPTGERALLLYPPGLEFVVAFFGCLYAGIVAVPAYPPRRNQNLSRLQAIAADAEAKVILTTATLVDTLQTRPDLDLNVAELHWVATDTLSLDLAANWQEPALSPESLAFLQYTSGSTGTPKGVMVSHGNLLHNSSIIHHGFGHNAENRGCIWLPPYHDMGLIGGVLQPLYGGFPVVLMSPVDFLQKPLRWLQAISRYRSTTSGGPNFAYDLCVQKVTPEQKATLDLSSWDVAFTGAEPIRAETLERFATAFAECGFRYEAFYPCYGMAETTLMVSGGLRSAPPVIRRVDAAALEQNQVIDNDHATEGRAIVGCGHSQLDLQVLIVNPDTRIRCSEKQVGEIWVAGSSVAQGYWRQPEQTLEVFGASLATGEGPYLRTGDLGFVHNNELFITGRRKDIIIIRGQNHYPQDIEYTVENSHPSLRPNAGAAFSVEFKNAEKLVIVHEVERSYLRKLNCHEVINTIKQAVISQHGLDTYATVLVKPGSIPKTSSGKIRRHACRAAFLTGSLEIVDDWSENPQNTSKFLSLQTEVESVLKKLQSK